MQYLARAQDFQRTSMRQYSDHFIYSTPALSVNFLYNWTQRIDGFSLLLQRYARKGNGAKNPAIFRFCLLPKELVKCNACAVARKTDCFSRNMPISNDPVVRISRNLAENRSETTWMIYQNKSEFWHREFLIIQKTINGELRKSPMSKFY